MNSFYPVIIFLFLYKSSQALNDCGVYNRGEVIDNQHRIVNGYDVGYYKYPWFAGLERGGLLMCGGTLITSRHVITAGHCYKAFPGSRPETVFQVRLGNINTCDIHLSVSRLFSVQQVYVHEKYHETNENIYFDVALAVLNTTAEQYMPICLPNKMPRMFKSAEAYVIGFGALKYDTNDFPCTLNEARLLMYSHEVCNNMLLKTEQGPVDPIDSTTVLCAGYLTGTFDACNGDSGGPLQVLGSDNRMYLSGIVSFGFDCAKPGLLGFYTNVTTVEHWIEDHVRLLSWMPTPKPNKWHNYFDYYKLYYNWLLSIYKN